MPLTTNTTKQRLKAGQIALGFGVHHLRTIATPVLAAATGHDWIFIDTEHGAWDLVNLQTTLMGFNGTHTMPLVRVAVDAPLEALGMADLVAVGALSHSPLLNGVSNGVK